MKDYVQRMIEELKELKERTQKLFKFLKSENFVSLSTEKQSLMTAQYHAMETYGFILAQRLAIEASEGNCATEDWGVVE